MTALNIDSSGLDSLGTPPARDQLLSLGVDVSQRDELRDAVNRAEDRFGSVDILCTCAAVDSPAPLLSITDDGWRRTMDVNALAVLSAVQCAAPVMTRAAADRSSPGLDCVVPGGSRACVVLRQQAAVVRLTKSIAMELADDNIRANCVCPGMVDTALAARHLPRSAAERAEFLDEMRSWQPLGLGSPEQLADLAVFLASDESSFMTGVGVASSEEAPSEPVQSDSIADLVRGHWDVANAER